jgi:hypothetical protein
MLSSSTPASNVHLACPAASLLRLLLLLLLLLPSMQART